MDRNKTAFFKEAGLEQRRLVFFPLFLFPVFLLSELSGFFL
jgi:hypothetical protein